MVKKGEVACEEHEVLRRLKEGVGVLLAALAEFWVEGGWWAMRASASKAPTVL